jgi:hypothetical protein
VAHGPNLLLIAPTPTRPTTPGPSGGFVAVLQWGLTNGAWVAEELDDQSSRGISCFRPLASNRSGEWAPPDPTTTFHVFAVDSELTCPVLVAHQLSASSGSVLLLECGRRGSAVHISIGLPPSGFKRPFSHLGLLRYRRIGRCSAARERRRASRRNKRGPCRALTKCGRRRLSGIRSFSVR